MKLHSLINIFQIVFYFHGYPQDNFNLEQYTIATDRPSASFASTIVPKGILIGELGYLYQNTKNIFALIEF